MLRFAKICGKPKTLDRMTGLTVEQFHLLAARLNPLWEQAERERLSRRERQRAIGQGRPYKLSTLKDKLLLLMVFYRFSLVDALLGWLFGLDASNVCRLRAKLEPLVEHAADPALGLPLHRRMPPGTKKIAPWEELLEVCPDFAEVMTDATEQPRRRPAKRLQRRDSSGKKKRPTLKTQITVTRNGNIRLGSRRYPGRPHDYAIWKREGTVKRLPKATAPYGDLGDDGAQNAYPAHHIVMPIKRRRNHRLLTRAEKRFHRWLARIRIGIEHVLSRMKKYPILFQVYRPKISDYNQRFRNIAALTNFRLAMATA